MTVEQFKTTQTHEFDTHFIFDEHGLQPFYWLDSIRKEYDGWQEDGKPTRTVEYEGHTYHLCYDYDKSGLDPWENPEYTLQTVPEFRIYFARDDELMHADRADKKAARHGAAGTITVRPRWPDMTSDGERVSVPDLGGPYVDVQVQASNHHPDDYLPMLRRFADAFGGSPRYFRDPHDMSNVGDLAVYVRVDRDASGPIHAADGPIARMHSLLEGDRSGYRKHVEDHTELPGYYVTTTLTPDRHAELIRGHDLAVEVKHYYPEHPRKFDPQDALYHPKVEVAFQTSKQDDTLFWSDVQDARRELEETLMNVLEWADLPLRGGDPYVSDQYFDADAEQQRTLRIVEDPTPEIESEQKARVMKVWGEMMESDRAVVRNLLTDGGEKSMQDAADDTGYSYRTIRRVVQRLEGIIQHSYGEMQLASDYVAQELISRVRAAETNFRKTIEDVTMKAADHADDRQRSKWSKVKQQYDIKVRPGDGIKQTLQVRYRPEDKDAYIDMMRSIRTAARDQFDNISRFEVETTLATGERKSVRSLATWKATMPTHDTEPSFPEKLREAAEWLHERAGVEWKEAEPHQRMKAREAVDAT